MATDSEKRPASNRPVPYQDILIGESKKENVGGFFNPAETLAIGSAEPQVFLPLGRHTARQLARDMRIIATMNVVYTLQTNMPQVMWFKYQGAIGVEGKGRKDLLQAIGARREERLAQARNYNGMYDRFSNQEQGPSGNGRLTG